MLELVDNLLNRITMYKLVMYYLIILIVIAAVLGLLGFLPFSFLSLVYSTTIICLICWAANSLFAWAFNAPANKESFWITALILVLIITPLKSLSDTGSLMFLGWASILAMASKYLLAIGKKHIFNPAAMAVVITAFAINRSASWWVGTAAMLPYVLVGGALVIRKLQRWDLVLSFLAAAFVTIAATPVASSSYAYLFWRVIANTPVFFFASIMLTEPLTTPPTRPRRILYGALTGFLFAPNIHLAGIYSTPELALLVSNIFSYLISPKHKYLLRLRARYRTGTDTADFVFAPDKPAKFTPGQYLEWTLGHSKSDSRGNRRYFTVASSPTEPNVRLGVKFYPKGSSFKRALLNMKLGDTIVASQLAGDFVLPRDKKKKLAFIAGGIGITPFRSMIKYLMDKNEKRNIALLYSNKTQEEINYKDVFDQAQARLGMKTIYTLTDLDQLPEDWNGYSGKISPQLIARELPDFRERVFYISGPRGMTQSFEKTLKQMGVHRSHIKIDFFPGFA